MKRKIVLILILFLGLSACDNRNTEVDRVTRAFALTIRTFVGFFQDDLNSCSAFFAVYDAITMEPQECDNGSDGFFQVTRDDATCDSTAPINAQANFTIVQDNCQDDGTDITSTGTMNLVLNFSSAGNIGILSSDALMAQGFTFVFSRFETRVDLSNNNLSCSESEDMEVDGDTCSVSSDCRSCNF